MLDFHGIKTVHSKRMFVFYRGFKNNKDEIQFHDNIYSVLITILYFDMTVVHDLLRSYTVMSIPYNIH